jgi:hypothetical protein
MLAQQKTLRVLAWSKSARRRSITISPARGCEVILRERPHASPVHETHEQLAAVA